MNRCPICHGRWSMSLGRYWHRPNCPDNPIVRSRARGVAAPISDERVERVLRHTDAAFPCGCRAGHGWDCLDNPYRVSEEYEENPKEVL